jgi:hypothetical protein
MLLTNYMTLLIFFIFKETKILAESSMLLLLTLSRYVQQSSVFSS